MDDSIAIKVILERKVLPAVLRKMNVYIRVMGPIEFTDSKKMLFWKMCWENISVLCDSISRIHTTSSNFDGVELIKNYGVEREVILIYLKKKYYASEKFSMVEIKETNDNE